MVLKEGKNDILYCIMTEKYFLSDTERMFSVTHSYQIWNVWCCSTVLSNKSKSTSLGRQF